MRKMLPFMVVLLLSACANAPKTVQPKVIAHRGFWKTEHSAQNSIASLKLADSIGCYGSEFDVYFTADNDFVVFHDREKEGVSMINDSSAKICNMHLSNGENIPSLDTYLAAAKELKNAPRLIFEVKSLDDDERERESVPLILKRLQDADLLSQTEFISFSLNVCKELIRLSPESKVYYLNGDLSPDELSELGFAGLDYNQKVLKDHTSWIRESHDLGLEVNVWTVNEEADLRYFIEQGVDYITTNEPLLLQSLLNEE